MAVTPAPSPVPPAGPQARLRALTEELAELQGQRNVIDGRIVEIVAELDEGNLLGGTGVRSTEHFVAWKTGCTPANAKAVTAVARRMEEFPTCVAGLRAGELSLDQVSTIAERALPGSDAHYRQLAKHATVNQLRTALRMAPKSKDGPDPEPIRSVRKITEEEFAEWRIRLPHVDAATFDAALQSHLDALVAQWKRDHGDRDSASETAPPFPTVADAFLRLVEHGWDADVAARPHGHRTTVVLHLDVDQQVGHLHLGPALSEAERRYLTCDATYETWFEKDGTVIGCGRETRQLSRRLRRALEYRHSTCCVPGCGATRGLHAHHIRHWEDGGPTELWNLVLVCPFQHRLHHRGVITISGTGDDVTVRAGDEVLTEASVARRPTKSPPVVAPYAGPSGERADWKWYDPFRPTDPRFGLMDN